MRSRARKPTNIKPKLFVTTRWIRQRTRSHPSSLAWPTPANQHSIAVRHSPQTKVQRSKPENQSRNNQRLRWYIKKGTAPHFSNSCWQKVSGQRESRFLRKTDGLQNLHICTLSAPTFVDQPRWQNGFTVILYGWWPWRTRRPYTQRPPDRPIYREAHSVNTTSARGC